MVALLCFAKPVNLILDLEQKQGIFYSGPSQNNHEHLVVYFKVECLLLVISNISITFPFFIQLLDDPDDHLLIFHL